MALLANPEAEQTSSVDRISVPNGGELVTIYRVSGDKQVPVVSYLKDTLGDSDPANDRLRQVWILSQKRQSFARHMLAALPFLYNRLPSSPPPAGRVPRPVLDLGKPYESTVGGLMQQALQVAAFDPLGTPYRAASRSYRMNRGQYRELKILETSAVLDTLSGDSEVRAVRARLLLSSRLLGGLVSDSNLELVHEKEAIRTEEMRGRNWELLRQQAERNHLVFEPLRIGGGPISHALLSISTEELASGPKPFHSQFLKISNPWNDRGVIENVRYKDKIPLALYSLEHPKIPYLLADMRHTYAPRRREVARRAFQDVAIGVFGFSRFANIEYFAASWFWNFVNNRRGANNNRSWRLRSYAELRQKLNADTTLDPDLRDELIRRTASLTTNPLEDRLSIDDEIARVQHAALVQRVSDPKGIPLLLERDRQDEAALISRAFHRKTAVEGLRIVTFGLYRKRTSTSSAMLAAIDRHRRIQTHTRYLEEIIASGPVTNLTLDMAAVKEAVQELSRLTSDSKDSGVRNLLFRVAGQTQSTAENSELLNALSEAAAQPTSSVIGAHQ